MGAYSALQCHIIFYENQCGFLYEILALQYSELTVFEENGNMENVFVTVLTTLFGAIAGTFFGALLIKQLNSVETKNIRKLAIKTLKTIAGYKTYPEAKSEFNKNLANAEKRAILVCLHKLGVPIEVSVGEIFDIKEIHFLSVAIDNDEIESMIIQIKKGHCDHLFFSNVDAYFTENANLKTIRNIAKLFVDKTLSKSKMSDGKVIWPQNWADPFSYGETEMIKVFISYVSNIYYFDENLKVPVEKKLDKLKQEIDIGLWDNCLQWNYESFSNLLLQKEAASIISRLGYENQKISQKD